MITSLHNHLISHPVCIQAVDKIKALIPADQAKNQEKVENAISKFCKTAVGKEKKLVCSSRI